MTFMGSVYDAAKLKNETTEAKTNADGYFDFNGLLRDKTKYSLTCI